MASKKIIPTKFAMSHKKKKEEEDEIARNVQQEK